MIEKKEGDRPRGRDQGNRGRSSAPGFGRSPGSRGVAPSLLPKAMPVSGEGGAPDMLGVPGMASGEPGDATVVPAGGAGGGGGGSVIAFRASGEAVPDSITTSICLASPAVTLFLMIRRPP